MTQKLKFEIPLGYKGIREKINLESTRNDDSFHRSPPFTARKTCRRSSSADALLTTSHLSPALSKTAITSLGLFCSNSIMSIVPPSGDKTSATSGRRRSTTSRPSFPPAHAAAIPPLVTWARRGVEASDVSG